MSLLLSYEDADEVRSLAQKLIRERGEKAAYYVNDQTLDMLDQGKFVSAARWVRVALVIHELNPPTTPR